MQTKLSDECEVLEKTPPLYKVILLNDDKTTMDFVVYILTQIFNHNLQSAYEIMLKIHKLGQGVCGIYTYAIAETKIMQVHKLAQDEGFPLRAIMEEE